MASLSASTSASGTPMPSSTRPTARRASRPCLEGTRSWAIAGRGQSFPRGQFPEGFVRVVSDGYREAMGLRLLAGRDLTPDDGPTGEPVVVVNQTLARTIWPGQNPIGQFLIADGLGTRERRVAGFVADVRHKTLEAAAGPEMYIPIRQTRNYRGFYLVVRSSLPPAALESALRASLYRWPMPRGAAGSASSRSWWIAPSRRAASPRSSSLASRCSRCSWPRSASTR